IPGEHQWSMIGVRTPELRKLAKELMKGTLPGFEETARRGERSGGLSEALQGWLSDLPHALFEENQLHAFVLSEMKDFGLCVELTESFLPFIDNWATCDQLSPKVFKKHRAELLPRIRAWIASGETYSVRFGIGMLMQHFLDDDFSPEYLELAASVRSDEYYVNMMTAWYFATALAKQWDAALPFIDGSRLDRWTHNKAIQKAVESYRITDGQKELLKAMRRRAGQ
ncbi:MAG: DNA alkylation repair protein, partial [Firmicutes bacterium]|nr:DNA alkylation repair protein [Bacillota bacterium]